MSDGTSPKALFGGRFHPSIHFEKSIVRSQANWRITALLRKMFKLIIGPDLICSSKSTDSGKLGLSLDSSI
jgi:hypothetical protein